MKHSYFDKYSDLSSVVHRLDPRTKLLASCAFILVVAAIPPDSWLSYAVCAGLLAIWFSLSHVPLSHILRRSLVVLPFVAVVAVFIPFLHEGQVAGSYSIGGWELSVTYDGLVVLRTVLVRAWLSITALILLTATTRMTDLLHAMERLRLPRVLVMMMSFMYRYIFVLTDEVMRLKMMRDSRNFGYGGSRIWQIRTVGHMIGTLLIRSYERAERVYAAMLSRGFNGQTHSLHQLRFCQGDLSAAILCAAALATAGVASAV
ncbi:MAG TPA: cobalt ECF transporter T component CbiQ [Dehalococcoidia bacterium]|nr:cobalt ECF transporter T component CbiQ [Dehalococcoidia bacterium]